MAGYKTISNRIILEPVAFHVAPAPHNNGMVLFFGDSLAKMIFGLRTHFWSHTWFADPQGYCREKKTGVSLSHLRVCTAALAQF